MRRRALPPLALVLAMEWAYWSMLERVTEWACWLLLALEKGCELASPSVQVSGFASVTVLACWCVSATECGLA